MGYKRIVGKCDYCGKPIYNTDYVPSYMSMIVDGKELCQYHAELHYYETKMMEDETE